MFYLRLVVIVFLFIATSGASFSEEITSKDSSASPGEKEDAKAVAGKLTLEKLKGLDPTQSYYKIHAHIMKANSLDDVKPFLSKESRVQSMASTGNKDKVDPKVRDDQIFKLLKALLNPTVKVTKQVITGQEAVLNAVPLSRSEMDKQFESMANSMADSFSKIIPGKKMKPKVTKSTTTGKILMRMEEGIWKLHKEKWSTKNTSQPKVSAAKQKVNSWCAGAVTEQFSRKPAAGNLYGTKFTTHKAEYCKTVNTLELKGPALSRYLKPSITLFLFNNGKLPLGQTFQTSSKDTFGAPHIHVHYLVGKKTKTKVFTGSDRYGLRLQFNKQLSNGMLTGYISLRLPDKSKSFINGYFHASIR